MIVVISDSHVPRRAPGIADKILERADRADRVVHCGDLVSNDVYQRLSERYDSFLAVKGNCDMIDLPNSETFEVGGTEFGVYHGTGIHPRGDHETLLDIARNKLEVDVLLHGHTHQEEIYSEGGNMLLNPGSCTGVGGGSSKRSRPTMMEVEVGEEIEVRIFELEKELVVKKERIFRM